MKHTAFNDIYMTYDEIRQPVTQQLTQFLDIWKRADKKEFFIELIFC